MSNDTLYNSISKYAVAGKADKEAYSDLRECASTNYVVYAPSGERAAEGFLKDCREAEDEFMEVNYGSDPDAKHTKGKRNGQWKYRTYLPGAYASAKSELSSALKEGIDPSNKGKSELTKLRAEVRSPVPPAERIRKALTALKNAIAEMPAAEAEPHLENIRRELGL